ncbi:MAG: YbaK/EbsC family protein [Marinobacterium sp.]|nr:YbaK/EbsC family protein [Marinobacterium sp.]
MSISITLNDYLMRKAGNYELIHHSFSEHMVEAAWSSNLPVREVAKAVVLKSPQGYMLAAIPSCNKIILQRVQLMLGQKIRLAKEEETFNLFGDCAEGAIPPVGDAFGMGMIWDDSLADDEEIYFEAGDHRHLVHLSGGQYMQLLRNHPHGRISCAADDLADLVLH